jgi:MORN repeat
MYAGEYFADKMHGFGVYNFANGHRYEGSWHEGKKQGLGMYSFRNGETQSGHWQNGVLNTLSTQNLVPASPVAVNHSKVLNAVQVCACSLMCIDCSWCRCVLVGGCCVPSPGSFIEKAKTILVF